MRYLKYILIIVCIFPTQMLSAQVFEVGVRQGVSMWLEKKGIGRGSIQLINGQNITYDKELTVKYHAKKKWLHELSLANYNFKNNVSLSGNTGFQQIKVYELRYAIQYDITYPGLGYMFPALRNMKTFIGVSLSPGLWLDNTELENVGIKNKSQYYTCMLGFHYTRIFPVTKRINISSQIVYATSLFDKYDTFYKQNININKRLGCNTSLSFRL